MRFLIDAVLTATVLAPGLALSQQPIVARNYASRPLVFEANQGQSDPQVRFLSRGKGYTAFLTVGDLTLSLRSEAAEPASKSARSNQFQEPTRRTVQIKLLGAASTPAAVGEDPQPGKVNYFIGNDPAKWHTHIPTYGKVRYENVYPGIDLLYHGNHGQIEYDFEVRPGSDPSRIEFEVRGADQVALDSSGNLILKLGRRELRLEYPVVYQPFGGQQVAVPGRYVVTDSSHVAFKLAQYDSGKPLVIDPTLVYSTYLGGSGNDEVTGLAVDSTGSVYLAGYTDSADFPLATLKSLPPGIDHVFVAKLDPTGSNLVYADYIGGNTGDYGYAIALNASNQVYVTGSTGSSDFPVVNAYQATYPGSFNGFLTRISADGSSLLYSTYFGGNGSDLPSSLALDGQLNIFVAGNTSSTNFPVVNAYQSAAMPNQGGVYGTYGFLSKFTPDGTALAYSTYFGGSSNVALNCGGTPCWPQPSSSVQSVSVDSNGSAYVAGATNTYDFPVTSGAYLTTNVAQSNTLVSFVSKFDGGGALQYSTYFYETFGFTNINAVAVDTSGSAYVAGMAFSDGMFPITSTSICDPSVYGYACSYAFVTKFDAAGATLQYSTFLGPNNSGAPASIVLDQNNNAYVLATTSSNSFGLVNGIEGYAGGNDLLLAEIDPVAGAELFATYLGGSSDEKAVGMVLDSAGNLYVTGTTGSTDFPTTQGKFQTQLGGSTDALVLKIGSSSVPSVTLSPYSLQFSPAQIASTSQPQQALLRNMSNAPLTVASIASSGNFAETDNCGSSVPPAGSCALSVTFTPLALGALSGSIAINDNAAGSPHVITLSGSGTGAIAALSRATLSFADTPVGVTSSAQSLILTNQGNASMTLGNVQVNSDFAENNNCPATLAPSSSCTFNVTFTPTASGGKSGTMTISDDAAGSPQTVGLGGTGADFSIATTQPSVTVKAGASATYTISVASVGGAFQNAIRLGCNGAPSTTACSLSSTAVTPGSNAVTVTVTISTTATSAASMWLRPGRNQIALGIPFSALGLFGVLLGGSRRFDREARMRFALFFVMSSLLFLSGCAGGTGIVNQHKGTPPGTYSITITATSGSLQHSLPLGMTVQ